MVRPPRPWPRPPLENPFEEERARKLEELDELKRMVEAQRRMGLNLAHLIKLGVEIPPLPKVEPVTVTVTAVAPTVTVTVTTVALPKVVPPPPPRDWIAEAWAMKRSEFTRETEARRSAGLPMVPPWLQRPPTRAERFLAWFESWFPMRQQEAFDAFDMDGS